MQQRTGGPFFRLLASRSLVPADHYRYATEATVTESQTLLWLDDELPQNNSMHAKPHLRVF